MRTALLRRALYGALTLIVLASALPRLTELGRDGFATREIVHINAVDALQSRLRLAAERTPAAGFGPGVLATTLALRYGYGESTLRLPGAVAGTLAVLAVWVLGRAIFGTWVSVYAVVLLALSPLHVWLSRTVGTDVWLSLLAPLTALAFWRAVQAPEATWRWGALAALALACATDYQGVLLLAALAVYAAVVCVRDPARIPVSSCLRMVGIAALAGVVAAYVLPRPGGSLVPVRPGWWLIAYITNLLAAGPADAPLAASALAAAALLGAAWAARTVEGGGLIVAWAVAGICGLVGRAWRLRTPLAPEHFSMVLPAYLLLAAAGFGRIESIARRVASARWAAVMQAGVLVLLPLIELPALADYFHQPPPSWREVGAILDRNAGPDDIVVPMQERDSVAFYAPRLESHIQLPTRPAIVPAFFVHRKRGWVVAPAAARLYAGWKRVEEFFERLPPVELSAGADIQVWYVGQTGRDQLLFEAAFFDLPTATLVRGDLLMDILRVAGPAPPVLWKVDQIALSRDPLDLRNPALLNVVYYLAEHEHGDRAASLAYRLATAEPNWPEAQEALAAFQGEGTAVPQATESTPPPTAEPTGSR